MFNFFCSRVISEGPLSSEVPRTLGHNCGTLYFQVADAGEDIVAFCQRQKTAQQYALLRTLKYAYINAA
jgi:hypothetical protein